MNPAKSYFNGFQTAGASLKMVLTVYLLNLALALWLALPFLELLRSHLGESLAAEKLLEQFDWMVLGDWARQAREGLQVLISQVKWSLPLFWMLWVFLHGGMLKSLNRPEEKFSWQLFFGGCGKYFWRFLRLSAQMLVLHVVALGLVGLLVFKLVAWVATVAETEGQIVQALLLGGLLLAVVLGTLVMVADYARFYLMLNESHFALGAVGKGFDLVFRRLARVWALRLLLSLVPALLIYLYFKLEGDIGMMSVSGIIAMALLQQLFVVLRVGLKSWTLASELDLYAQEFIRGAVVRQRRQERKRWATQAEDPNAPQGPLLLQRPDAPKPPATENPLPPKPPATENPLPPKVEPPIAVPVPPAPETPETPLAEAGPEIPPPAEPERTDEKTEDSVSPAEALPQDDDPPAEDWEKLAKG